MPQQIGLTEPEIVWRSAYHGRSTRFSRRVPQPDCFDNRRIGDPNQHRYATGYAITDALDDFQPQPVAKGRSFTRAAEDEHTRTTCAQHMVDQLLKARDVQSIRASERSDEGRNDAPQWTR